MTFGVPVAGLGVLLAKGAAPALGMLCVSALTRVMLALTFIGTTGYMALVGAPLVIGVRRGRIFGRAASPSPLTK